MLAVSVPTALAGSPGAGAMAHGAHYGIVGVGVVGLIALLAPRLLARPTPREEHHGRVLRHRTALGPENPGTEDLATDSLATAHDPIQVARLREPVLTAAQRILLPLAVVSSAAAAGVHAAVGPAHFRDAALVGLFFAGTALLQLVWAGAVAVDCSRALLMLGVVGNVAVLALWGVTRTLGLPFGVLPVPEAIGPWDVACGAWELVVVCSCISLLQSPDPVPARVADWRRWHRATHWFLAASVLGLVALSLSGASA